MGIDAIASFGYGLKVNDKKLIDAINEGDEDFEGKDLSFMFHGSDENNHIVIVIKKSEISIDCWEAPKSINDKKFSTYVDWNKKLLLWAREHNIKKPKIGWWLCCSMG